MRKAIYVLLLHLIMAFHLFLEGNHALAEAHEEKAEVFTNTLSPPEGNTTFLGGTSWCVARPGSAPVDLQIALDWACGLGKSDCGPIQPGGPCFQPDNLLSHASYAFNTYYQQNGNSDIACYFGGTAVLTQTNPSYAKCLFATSESLKSSSSSSRYMEMSNIWWKIDIIILLLLYLVKR